VILGTSHYGEPDRFGVLRKPYRTPFGDVTVEVPLVEELARRAPKAVVEEDYCHAVEHSIEFQAVFLQHAVGPSVKMLPILCGPFTQPALHRRAPERHPEVERFLDALREIGEREKDRLFWVLGVDMAHVGMRYGDGFAVRANEGKMLEVEQADRRGIVQICEADTDAYLDHMIRTNDELKWCGFPPFYAFMRAVPGARGQLLHYEQWNIDPQSVVSFAGIEFFPPG
jgi:AmmeMemoRadiSam system protein B